MKFTCPKNKRHGHFVHNVPIPKVLTRTGREVERELPAFWQVVPPVYDHAKVFCVVCGAQAKVED